MNLKKQLLFVGALTLLIPLAGIQFVLQLENALRDQELERLEDQAVRIAAMLERHLTPSPSGSAGRTIFAETFKRRLILDGYGDDWPNRLGEDGVPLLYQAGKHMAWRAAVDDDNLWLFLAFDGLTPVFSAGSGGFSEGKHKAPDRLILSWRTPGEALQEYRVEARAPGRAQVHHYHGAGRDEAMAVPPIEAVWQTQKNGFSIELQLPRLPAGSQFGFSLEHPRASGPAESIGNLGRVAPNAAGPDDAADLPQLLLDQPDTTLALSPFITPGQSLTLISHDGWQLARVDAPLPGIETDISRFSPLELVQQATLQMLRLLLRANQDRGPALAPEGGLWHGAPLQHIGQAPVPGATVTTATHVPGEAPSLTAIVPVSPAAPVAYLVSRRSTEALLSLSSATLGQVLSRSLLLTLTLLLVLMGYASWLSWRISRLRRSVSSVVDDEGRVNGSLSPSKARDELGDLSRHFARLVGQVRGYTQYLESFARKLSHELKTPLAVMRSSLDNLQHSDPNQTQSVYIERASDGADRLSRILTAMSEASRLERSLARTDRETFDLALVLAMAAEGYASLDSRVRYQGPEGPCLTLGAPDLLVQALDKLVENARDFAPQDGEIAIGLQRSEGHWILRVCNDGPLLPASMAEHIFDSFISVRNHGSESGHLGQGLVIVKLVADFHRGRVDAENRSDGSGVCFRLFLPAEQLT